MSEKKVSILVPVYKVPERFLRKNIESCIHQTLNDIEIILVDDGSPDNCGKICDEYALLDSRIKVVHQENKGLSTARNSAFDIASGEYITFLDGDDYLEPEACETAYKCAKEHNVEIVMWGEYWEFPHRTEISKPFGNKELEFRNNECKKLQIRVLDFNGMIAQVFSKLIDRQFLINYNIRHVDELKQGAEGFVFNIQLFEHATSAYYLPTPLLHYTYNEKSISHSSSEENNYLIIRCFEWIKDYIQTSKNKEELEDKLYNRMLYVICTTAITGYFNPNNLDSYQDKVKKFKKFMNEPLVNYSLKNASREGISIERKGVLFLVETHQYFMLEILGKMRRKQLAER